MKDLTEAERLALEHLLYLVTNYEAVNKAVLSSYESSRSGNPGLTAMLPATPEFAAVLATLYIKSAR